MLEYSTAMSVSVVIDNMKYYEPNQNVWWRITNLSSKCVK